MVWPKGEPQAAETQKMSFLILCLNTSCRLQYLFQRVTILPSIMFYLLCHYHKKCLSKEWFILTVFKSSMQSDKFDTRYSSLWWNYHSSKDTVYHWTWRGDVIPHLCSKWSDLNTRCGPDTEGEGSGEFFSNLLSYLSIFITNRQLPLIINMSQKKTGRRQIVLPSLIVITGWEFDKVT